MWTKFEHIVKNALENLEAPQRPDWKVFYELLRVELPQSPDEEALGDDQDEILGDALHSLDYMASTPAWTLFEGKLDELNTELDAEFDSMIGGHLDDLSGNDGLAGSWEMMSVRLDELNAEMDDEFDQTVGNALQSLPEMVWNERHWQMFSRRLDQLNNRTRILLIKVAEIAAIILLLMQLTNLYTGIQQDKRSKSEFATQLDHEIKTNPNSSGAQDSELNDPNIQNSFRENDETDVVTRLENDTQIADSGRKAAQSILRADYSEQTPMNREQNSGIRTETGSLAHLTGISPKLDRVNSDFKIDIPMTHLREIEEQMRYSSITRPNEMKATPQLDNDPQLIAYSYEHDNSNESSPRLDVRDINLLSANTTDSILTSIPTLQVIRPRIHSSMEVGILADATNVEVQDYWSVAGSYQVPTINPGGYFRYKIQYQNMFGSLGGDYLNMKYDGLGNDNELTLISLPLELGYNVVNLPSLRMYFSAGIAGRFVPIASYNTAPLNQNTVYGRKSQKPSNGLLNKGPFEINSYLSGRLSMGLDINVNKKTSVSLRFSHDTWLKGEGIGYNHDRFRSSHLAIGTNFHF